MKLNHFSIFNRTKKETPFFDIASIWVLSCIIIVFIFPDTLFNHQVSHLRYQDLEVEYMSFFTLLSQIYNGGIQLWNPYDQAPNMLHHVAGGLYNIFQFTNILAYFVFESFYDSSGEAFLATASTVPYFISNLILTIGSYLLIKRFSSRRIVLFFCVILSSSLLSSIVYYGVNGRHLVYFYPLMFHLILRFFEYYRLKDGLLAFVVITIATQSSPFIGPGYFYQGVHFFIISALLWCLFRKNAIYPKFLIPGRFKCNGEALFRIGMTTVLFVVVISPILFLVQGNIHDYSLGQESGRTASPFSVIEYFKRNHGVAVKSEFFLDSLNWNALNSWWDNWVFLGFGTLFLATCGIFLNKDKRKYIFFGSIVFLWLINGSKVPHDIYDLPSILVHIVNAFTNPGNSLVRSYHQPSAFAIPYLLAPLVAMGLESILSIIEAKWKPHGSNDSKEVEYSNVWQIEFSNLLTVNDKIKNWKSIHLIAIWMFGLSLLLGGWYLGLDFIRNFGLKSVDKWISRFDNMAFSATVIYVALIILLLLVKIFSTRIQNYIQKVMTGGDAGKFILVGLIMGAIASFVFFQVALIAKIYLLISILLCIFILYLIAIAKPQPISLYRPFFAFALIILFMIDFWGLKTGSHQIALQTRLEKLEISGLEKQGKVILDFQNPKIHPFRNYYNTNPIGLIPGSMTVNPFNHQGPFFRYLNFENYMKPVMFMSDSRHRSFEPIHQSPALKDYLTKDNRIFYQAKLAIEEDSLLFDEILSKKLDRTVVMINTEDSSDQHSDILESMPIPLPDPFTGSQQKFINLKLIPNQAEMSLQDDLLLYTFDLPREFPKYSATTIFTQDDSLLKLIVNERGYQPVQGRLVAPYQFDVQNMIQNKLVIAVPQNQKLSNNDSVMFLYPQQKLIGITKIYQNESDSLDFDYVAEEDGWLVMHYPYDKKWQMTVNGKAQKLYRANYSFMTTPVKKGSQRLLLEYWPETYLRFFLGLSIVVTQLAFWFVVFVGIRQKPEPSIKI